VPVVAGGVEPDVAVERLVEQHEAREARTLARLEQVESDDRSGARVRRQDQTFSVDAVVEAGDLR